MLRCRPWWIEWLSGRWMMYPTQRGVRMLACWNMALTVMKAAPLAPAAGDRPSSGKKTRLGQVVQKTDYRRPLLKGSPSATRCRTFHCKLTDASIVYLNEQVNEWVDQQEDVEIKFVVSNIDNVEDLSHGFCLGLHDCNMLVNPQEPSTMPSA